MTQAVNLANFANNLDSSGGVSPSALNSAVPIAKGGTNAITASAARTNLGLAIGTDIPSATGTGASGTWAINISGNAATATDAVNATNATNPASGGSFITTSNIGSQSVSFATNATNAVTAANAIGVGQSWQTTTLANNTTYTNTTGRTVAITARCNGTGGFGFTDQVFVNGTRIMLAYFDAAVVGMTYFFIVPNGQTYSVSFGTGVAEAFMLRS